MKFNNTKIKKAAVLAAVAVLSLSALTACGSKGSTNGEGNTEVVVTEESALKLLENVWSKYGEDEQFAIMGGDMSTGIMGNAGSFSLEDAAMVDSTLGVPEDLVANVEEAASMIHMMNANTFTCGAFKVKDMEAKDFAASIEEHLSDRQWICGFPEKLYIAFTADGYVISAFGAGDLVTPFAEKLAAEYNVEIAVEKNLE